MSFLRFILGLPEKHSINVEPATVSVPKYKVILYTQSGIIEYIIEEEPYYDDGGSISFITRFDRKEHCYHGEWEYFEL